MNIVLTYSSKAGLQKAYLKRYPAKTEPSNVPVDFFAEGDSPRTIAAVMEALRSGGHRVTGLEGDDQLPGQLEKIRPDLVFNIAEGLFGDLRESYVPFICEQLGIPYTGSDPLTLGICLNKLRAKEIMGYYGIPTPAFRVFYPNQPLSLPGFRFPGIVKPVSEGSSKGIFNNSVVNNESEARQRVTETLKKYHQPVLLEEFLTGAEFTVALWGNGEAVEVLPIIEIDHGQLPPGAHPIYSYEAKWVWDTVENPLEIYRCPAVIAPELRKKIATVALQTYRVMQLRDWSRIDIRLDEEGEAHVLEINPLPGILPDPRDNSCFPKAARTAGYTYEGMINRVIEIALQRLGGRS
jgi:D-alanine-D-alanine ligase